MPKAFTRALSPRLSDCELTHLERQQIDVERARLQHSAYERILEQNGLEVIRLPDLPSHPDGVFVEDTALLLNEHAIITRPGAASRLAETDSTAALCRFHPFGATVPHRVSARCAGRLHRLQNRSRCGEYRNVPSSPYFRQAEVCRPWRYADRRIRPILHQRCIRII